MDLYFVIDHQGEYIATTDVVDDETRGDYSLVSEMDGIRIHIVDCRV